MLQIWNTTKVNVYDKREGEMFNSNDNNFFRVILTLSTVKTKVNRSYIKVQKVAADVGGILKFMMVALFYFNFIFSKLYFLRYLKTKIIRPKVNPDF